MSIISTYDTDNSAALAKRFAALTRGYLDAPETAQADFARVPLENVFRMLEMFRYGSFADENRRGVLALGNSDLKPRRALQEGDWHSSIEAALTRAFNATYAGVPKEEAIEQLQGSLRCLASGTPPVPEALQRAKGFFDAFQTNV